MENKKPTPEKDQKVQESKVDNQEKVDIPLEEKESPTELEETKIAKLEKAEVIVAELNNPAESVENNSEEESKETEISESEKEEVIVAELNDPAESVENNSEEESKETEISEPEKEEVIVVERNDPAESVEDKSQEESKETEVLESDKTEDKPEESKTAVILEEVKVSETEKLSIDNEEKEEEAIINFDELNKEQLVDLLDETVKSDNVSDIKNRISSIKVAYLKISKEEKEKLISAFMEEGGKIEDFQAPVDPLDEKFKTFFDIYKTNKARFNKDQEELKQKNLDQKKKILDDLKELISSEETLKKTYDEFKVLQDSWKEIGMVPQGEVNNLWQSYHFLVEKFFDKVKINKELRDLDLRKNLEIKIELCEKAEELLLETSIIKSFKKLQQYHEEWKEVGPTPNDKKDEIWDRFKSATDKINDRRKEHYENLHDDQKSNLEAKEALCEKAEEIMNLENDSLKDWQVNTNQMNDLMKVWKTVGQAPKKNNDEVWNRFKSALNTFFDHKKDYYQNLKDQQLNNYNLKVDLCIQAEAIKDSTDWKKTTNDLIALQKEWKTIGPVPKKYSDKIWKRFRAICDSFFTNKSDYYSNIHVHESNNLETKKALIGKIENFKFGDDKNENLNQIKEFQREWMEIGHVPIKDKDKVQNEYRKAVDDHFDKLKISKVEVSAMNYKAKFDNLKDSPDTRNLIYKERTFLTNRISQLRDDINLWENNIGFLAESKQANILKAEFEKKIDKSKQDLVIMETKLKALNDAQK